MSRIRRKLSTFKAELWFPENVCSDSAFVSSFSVAAVFVLYRCVLSSCVLTSHFVKHPTISAIMWQNGTSRWEMGIKVHVWDPLSVFRTSTEWPHKLYILKRTTSKYQIKPSVYGLLSKCCVLSPTDQCPVELSSHLWRTKSRRCHRGGASTWERCVFVTFVKSHVLIVCDLQFIPFLLKVEPITKTSG